MKASLTLFVMSFLAIVVSAEVPIARRDSSGVGDTGNLPDWSVSCYAQIERY
jgi:hypothetical protein